MLKKKKQENEFSTRTRYEAPQVVCFQYEAERGILTGSTPPEPPAVPVVNATTSFGLTGQNTETRDGFWETANN